MLKLYTKEELIKKYSGRFINTYPHHHEVWDDETHQYKTVYEVRKVSKTIKENFNSPENI